MTQEGLYAIGAEKQLVPDSAMEPGSTYEIGVQLGLNGAHVSITVGDSKVSSAFVPGFGWDTLIQGYYVFIGALESGAN